MTDNYDYQERAAIMEYDGGLPRAKAEKMASETHWTCCGIRYPYTVYRCSKCGTFTKDAGHG